MGLGCFWRLLLWLTVLMGVRRGWGVWRRAVEGPCRWLSEMIPCSGGFACGYDLCAALLLGRQHRQATFGSLGRLVHACTVHCSVYIRSQTIVNDSQQSSQLGSVGLEGDGDDVGARQLSLSGCLYYSGSCHLGLPILGEQLSEAGWYSSSVQEQRGTGSGDWGLWLDDHRHLSRDEIKNFKKGQENATKQNHARTHNQVTKTKKEKGAKAEAETHSRSHHRPPPHRSQSHRLHLLRRRRDGGGL